MRRAWIAAGAWLVATALAARDGRAPWTVFVAVATGVLAALVVASEWADARPGREERAKARQQAQVEEILWRYERERKARDRADQG